MSERGPDSAGFAVYGPGAPGRVKLTLRGADGFDYQAFFLSLRARIGEDVSLVERGTHAVLTVRGADADEAEKAARAASLAVVGRGARMELYKEVGAPAEVARRFRLAQMSGTHGIGHTRMATESAVTTAGAHPFSTGPDQCLVHNGSLSNHNGLRRDLRRRGFTFETQNDTEVAAMYLSARMRDGDTLGASLQHALDDLDGFYTFVVGTETGFGVLRDPIACKPAVMAETDDYVAFGSEYRALANLPRIEQALVWEPKPGQVYFWDRAP
jgi:glutamate synthase domain-containing protein 1